jgi:hypothetical protein
MRNYTSSYDFRQKRPKRSYMIVRFWRYGRKFLCESGLSESQITQIIGLH